MRFTQSLLAGATFVAAAMALAINDYPQEVVAGKSYTVTYDDKSNTPTTFTLRKGDDADLGTIGVLTTSATSGTFTWNVASSLVNGNDYALQITQGSTTNYVGHIKLTGGSSASASASSASASASASSASSASASSASSASAKSASSASVTSAAASASASISNSSNGTITSATLSGSRTPSASATGKPTGSSTNSAGAPQNTGAASTLVTSPLALIGGAVAAMLFL